MKLNISELFITQDKCIFDALSIINEKEIQIALVVDIKNKLVGTITDGDIRRGLLKGLGLDSPLEKVTNKNFQSINFLDDRNKANMIMKKYGINMVPILDNNGEVIEQWGGTSDRKLEKVLERSLNK